MIRPMATVNVLEYDYAKLIKILKAYQVMPRLILEQKTLIVIMDGMAQF